MSAFLQNVPTSSAQKKTLTLFSYAGGLDNVSSHTTASDQCATNVLNMEFLEDGLIQKRFGTSKFTTYELPNDITFIDRFLVEGEEEKLIVCTNSEVYVNGVKLCDVLGRVEGITFRNTYLFVDGTNLYSYSKNATTNVWEVRKVISPTNLEDTLSARGEKGKNTITVSDGTKYTVKQYIQIGEYKEGNEVKPLTARILSINGNVLTLGEQTEIKYIKTNFDDGTQTTETRTDDIPTYLQYDYDAGTKITLFETAEQYKYEGDLKNDDTAMTRYYEPCIYELEDAYKGLNKVPTHPDHITFHKDAVWITSKDEPSTVYISHQNNMYYFPVVKSISVPANGDKINGLVSFHDSLIVSRFDDMHVIYGETNNPDNGEAFYIKQITTHTGCISGNTLKVVHNYLFYLGNDGIAYKMCTTNTDIRLLSTQVLSQRVNFLKSPFNYTLEDMKTACSTFTNDNYYLAIKDKVFIYSYRFMAWTVFDRMLPTYMFEIDGDVIWGKGKKLMHFDKETFLDEGIAFNCFWESKLFDFSTPTIYKYFKYISLVFDVYEHFDSVADIVFEIDYEDIAVNFRFVNQISRWGQAKWGDRFATRNINKSVPIYVGRRGRLLKIKIRNGYNVTKFYDTVASMQSEIHTIGTCSYVSENQKHYIVVFDEDVNMLVWKELDDNDINQPIKLYNIEMEYSLRGRR